jgi:hypothetical protein
MLTAVYFVENGKVTITGVFLMRSDAESFAKHSFITDLEVRDFSSWDDWSNMRSVVEQDIKEGKV